VICVSESAAIDEEDDRAIVQWRPALAGQRTMAI